ncbi:histidinol-phosphate transaminase [Pseudoclavibacter sp. 13-3]|uniref:histidinol-phosphate transaminase n=1 Tax=Pseudoclavibacter sp. 13-3 TaxID=2901228 RepID=UPI001E3898C7|nr:histidinol-phosphate transaminase [Pseudoclavibacter sp. 13-3]
MTTLDDLPLRAELVGQQPYGAPQLHVPIELNVNENTFGLPEEAVRDIQHSVAAVVTGLNRYPDREFTALREALAEYLGHDLTPEQIWAANGSNEVLQQVLQAFGGPGRSLLSFVPTYSMYPLLAAGTQTKWLPINRQPDFVLDPDAVAAAIREHRPDLVFICRPNNPTGTGASLEVIEAAYAATEGIVVVDEAYQEFSGADAASALTLLPGRPRLAISRTMSKAFAYAGARVGYLAADPAFVDALRLVRLPYHLSALTQAAAEAALRHAPAMLANVDRIRAQRDRIERRVAELGFTPYPSASNFVLIGGVADPKDTFTRLLAEGIIVRDNGIPHTLRVTAGTESETSAFLAAFERIATPVTAG